MILERKIPNRSYRKQTKMTSLMANLNTRKKRRMMTLIVKMRMMM
ncbi:unnamed protein product [Larinioides sclopetarius]|uniref:Uncharacterized protein n=1 Tax=Larinioides sclopetarius TaxID=280406 RepID=A0AAV1YYZ3_9ARAC